LTSHPGREFRRLLEAERRRLQRELDAVGRRAAADADMPRTGAEGGEDDALVDAAIHTLERDRDSAVESSLQALLAEIEQALARLRQGTYGICARCRRPISAQRLRAIPYATLCIECKEAQERVRPPFAAVPFREWRVFKPPRDVDDEEAPERPPRMRRAS
jgi:DnaK suppressor protein